MPKLAIRHVEHNSIINLSPVSVPWKKNKLRIWIDEVFDEPWASDTIDLNFLASDPFHKLESVLKYLSRFKLFGGNDPLDGTLAHADDTSSDLDGLGAVVGNIKQGEAELRVEAEQFAA